VVADVAAPRDGSYLEWIGNYDPMADPPSVTLKNERAAHWLSMGAIPSDAVSRILDQNGLMERTQTFKGAGGKPSEEPASGGTPAAVATPPQAAAPAEAAPVEAAPVGESPAEEPPAEEESSGDAEPAE